MKNNSTILKTIGLLLILTIGGIAHGATYYLTSTGAGAAQIATNWNANAAGGGTQGQNFLTSGDIFIIPSNITGIVSADWLFGDIIANGGSNLTLIIDGTLTINSGAVMTLQEKNGGINDVIVNGTIIFMDPSINQIIGTVTGNGRKSNNKFTLSSGATLVTSHNFGISSTTTGSINSTNLTTTFAPDANYVFNGGSQNTTGLPTTVNNLDLSNSGIKTFSAATTVSNNLSIGTGATLNTGNFPLTLQGNFLNNGTFTAGSSAITLSGANTQSIAGFTTAGDVTVNKSANSVTLSGSSSFANLTITAGNLTIPAGAQLTITSNLTNTAGVTGLTLLSGDASGTGSLIVNGSATGTATLTRAMTSGAWHLVASPLEGQIIQDFLSANPTIPTTVAASNLRAIREYLPVTNEWGEFFTTGAGGTTGNLLIGKGYCIRVKSSTNHEVIFTGIVKTGDIPVSSLSAGNWNCIGNPYTSAIGVNVNTSNTANFLTVNATNIDPAYGIYIWDKPDAANGNSGQYTAISNVPTVGASYPIQQGQGFMVKMATGKTSVNFTKAMQLHDVSLTLKSTENIWPMIQLKAEGDSASSSTVIAFHEGMTNGLDPTYDAGLLKSGGTMELYTRLIDDYGIPFAIQALPSDQYDQLIIPIGVDYFKGGMVSFSAQGMYLPSSCRPILEDRLTGIFTDLSDKTYTADLSSNMAGTGRFFLHTSYATTGTNSQGNAQGLSAWAIGRQEININGKVNNGAVASLYDMQGRLIVTHAMREVICNRISLPFLNPGIYLLQIRDQQKTQAMKVSIGQ